ncbi:MAG: hypothetical protein Q4E63_05065 [Prevotellaceae bacterium]|nr:hypothetical protein [Prevotellaceae bacterium]
MAVKNSKRFAEIERLMSDYFGCHLAPVMSKVQQDLSRKQADEMRAYSSSTAGILRSMASANMPGDDPYATLRITGEWNSKTTEDYLAMCKDSILGNRDMQRDLAIMAGEWRKAVVTEIGRERYDALSRQLGCDLAYAYIDHRMEKLMIDRMVKDKMPKSSADYILRKAAQTSLFSLPYELNKSPLAAEIEAKGEAAYKPSKTEITIGWAAGASADAVTMGGVGSWATFARFVGVDVVFNAGMEHLSKKNSRQEVSVEDCISKGVFGTNANVFTAFRKDAQNIKNHENSYIKATNDRLKKKIPTKNYMFMDWIKQPERTTLPWNKGTFLDHHADDAAQRKGKYKDVPLMVAPGQEDEYLKIKERQETEVKKEVTVQEKPQDTSQERQEQNTETVTQLEESAIQTNENGWDGLLQSFGLNGFSDIGKNLGYVLAMLPNVLVGLFTGKTKSLNMDNSLLPLATIAAGIFVKNPILKIMLMGMGGANLLNKTGHEVLDRKQHEGIASPATNNVGHNVQFRQYPDEPLNPRISTPMLQGRCLVTNIDNVPCTIQLPDTVIGAYQSGALPLNTLANAILAKNDQLRQMAAVQYEKNAHEEVIRPRGIQ